MQKSSSIETGKTMLGLFSGQIPETPPIWLMRQAGRYLPEYLETRAQAGSFLNLCYSPERATEVTLQPIRRYAFDAAILFSDILVVPDALGQSVRFVQGEGPQLDPISTVADLARLDLSKTNDKFSKVWQTVTRLRQELPKNTTLIGFCGAPWTVATYVVAGKGSADQAAARRWAFQDPSAFRRLIDILTEASITYLNGQIEAGADVLQIFDSWAGSLPDDEFEKWVIEPTAKIVSTIRKSHPDIPIIGFPRGASAQLHRFVSMTKVNGVSCDTSCPLPAMRGLAQSGIIVQGNLDPLLLVAGGQALNRRIDEILDVMRGLPFIFNLGHGIVPDTPPEHVKELVDRIRRSI